MSLVVAALTFGKMSASASNLDPRVCPPEIAAKQGFLGTKYASEHYIEMFDGRFVCGYGEADYNDVISGYKKALARANEDANTPPTLVLHFHGGLDSGELGFQNASIDYDTYTDKGLAYPIFFMWHSGAGEIGSREVLPQSGYITTAHGLIDRWNFIHSRALERQNDGTDHADLTTAEWQDARPNPQATLPNEAVDTRETQMRLENLANGANMWAHMNREIDDAFAPFPNRGGFRLVVDLADIAEHWKGPGCPRVILVGHSMGSIFASKFVEAYYNYTNEASMSARSRSLKFDLVFLAPAVTYDEFMRAIDTGMIGHFRMFTMSDRCERLDHVAKAALESTPLRDYSDWYPRSLLYYVSSVTGPYPDVPLLGLARFLKLCEFDNDPVVTSVRDWMTESYHSVVLSPTSSGGTPNRPGFESTAISHGDFDTDPATLRSIRFIIERGFGPGDPQPVPAQVEIDATPQPSCLGNTPSFPSP